MKTNFLNLKACLASVLVAVLMVSCSKSADVLESIPQSSRFVLSLNPLTIAKKVDQKGATIKGMSAEDAKLMEGFLTGDYGLDPEQLAVFEYDGTVYAVTSVTDEDKLMAVLEGEKSVVNGVTVFNVNGNSIAVKDGLCWYTDGSRDIAKDIDFFTSIDPSKAITAKKKFKDNIKGGDFGGYFNVGAVYSDERFMNNMPANISSIPYYEQLKSSELYYQGEGSKDDFKITAHLYDAEGNNLLKKINMPEFDTDLLKFIDAESSFVYAVAMDEFYVSYLKDMAVSSLFRNEEKAMVKTAFNNIEGNIVMGVRINSLVSLRDIQISAAAKLKDGAEKNLKALLDKEYKADQYGEYTVVENPAYSVRLGFKDDCVYVTNNVLPKENFKDSKASKFFKDVSSAMYVDCMDGSVFSTAGTAYLGKPVAGYIYAKSDDEKAELVVHVEHNDMDNIYAYFVKILGSI